MKIIIAPEALADLAATIDHIAEDDPAAAARLADRVFEMIDQLAEGGLNGPEHVLRTGEKVRSWPVPPLRIYYQRGAGHFAVLRIYHHAREPIGR